MSEIYSENLLRAAVAYLQLQAQMTAAQQMFAKGYPALSSPERYAVDQFVLGGMANNFHNLTPESLTVRDSASQKGSVGFVDHTQPAPRTDSNPAHPSGPGNMDKSSAGGPS